MTDKPKLSEWLADFDSHTVYDVSCLDDCPLEGAREVVPVQTHAQVKTAIQQRGLGGTLAPDNGHGLVSGYMMAEALGRKALGPEHDGSWNRYQGRGSRFRAVIADLQAAGL